MLSLSQCPVVYPQTFQRGPRASASHMPNSDLVTQENESPIFPNVKKVKMLISVLTLYPSLHLLDHWLDPVSLWDYSYRQEEKGLQYCIEPTTRKLELDSGFLYTA